MLNFSIMSELLDKVGDVLEKEPRLIRLPKEGKAVFIGDTHGDLEATQQVLKKYFKPGYILVFLGDYVDRGPHSRENIELLFKKKLESPNSIYLLMGNHEGYPILPFSPADFWEGLTLEEQQKFGEIFKKLPFVAITQNGLIALHGVPPDVPNLDAINEIKLGSKAWFQITWGDFSTEKGDYFGNIWGRPVFGQSYFERVMNNLKRSVLVRAHQPHIEPKVFDDRCLTIFTSSAYHPIRTIAIVALEGEDLKTTNDLNIEFI